MIVREHVPLSTLTTLRTGGEARYVLEAASPDEVVEALAFARARNLSVVVLGEGSNMLAADEGYAGVVLRLTSNDLRHEEDILTADAGVSWEALVQEAATKNLWGLENLAGIPGTVGAAPIQNIGAYGIEAKDVIAFVDALSLADGSLVRLSNEECGFGYRDSRFKRDGMHIIMRVGFSLSVHAAPQLSYPDLVNAQAEGVSLSTPQEIGDAVRAIRTKKFPDLSKFGTAGSFFKNPIVEGAHADELHALYPELPAYEAVGGVKIPLAYILDKVLNLRGHRSGAAWLYDKQPLVLVLDAGGSAHDVDVLADDVAMRVFDATKIKIEREVRTLK
jgi:UDP-N-acetylmuramate dehydrogenase